MLRYAINKTKVNTFTQNTLLIHKPLAKSGNTTFSCVWQQSIESIVAISTINQYGFDLGGTDFILTKIHS